VPKRYVNQSGADGVQGFETILAALPPAMREAFEAERRQQQANLERNLHEARAENGSAYAGQFVS
jgi:hypothetical protein